jgi:hypothetical protein
MRAHAFSGHIAPSANGVIWTNLFFDEIIMVAANHGDALLHGGTREPTSRANGDHLGTSGIGTRGKISDVERQRFARQGFRKEAVLGAEREIIVEVTSIGVNGGRG